jgi:hypothetical protein
MRGILETTFDNVYEGEMCFIFARQRHRKFDCSQRYEGEIRGANNAVDSRGGQCGDMRSDSEHRARSFSNHFLSDRTEDYFAPSCAAVLLLLVIGELLQSVDADSNVYRGQPLRFRRAKQHGLHKRLLRCYASHEG